MIAELRDEACTLWASGWLGFQHKASKVFSRLSFNFPVPAEDEVGEFDFDGEDGLGVSLTALALLFFLATLRLRLLQRLALLPRSLGLHLLTYMVWRFG